MLALVEDARGEGLDVTFDGYPYAYSSTRLNIVIPQWAFDGGLASLRRNLADPDVRGRMKKEMGPRAASWHDMWVTHFKRPEHHRFEGRSLAEVAELMGLDVVDAICELLLREDQQVSFVSAGANMATLPRFVSHPLYMVGSDAVLIGDYPSPRTYGTFPVILAEFVREERWLGLADAIRKMTSFPAQRLGLPDRGLLRDGFKADVVVFDAAAVKAPATRREPKQFPVGIEQVIVNGRVVVDEGRHTGVLAGRALRRGRATT
jgi:N-acyl-D-amino-acid deacylase